MTADGGTQLPDGAVLGPDAAWVRRERLTALSAEQLKGFLPLAPDFVIELRSPSDRPPELEAKMAEYAANGVRLGWLIDPFARTVKVYRPGREPELLTGPERISGDPELPGFVLELEGIWKGLGDDDAS
ncbi:MAG TPA: Uma2 family endonuclease [Anaerolineae bacterium]|nr:Uma2 family endonuclease [Anaerolineae bacterium]